MQLGHQVRGLGLEELLGLRAYLKGYCKGH